MKTYYDHVTKPRKTTVGYEPSLDPPDECCYGYYTEITCHRCGQVTDLEKYVDIELGHTYPEECPECYSDEITVKYLED